MPHCSHLFTRITSLLALFCCFAPAQSDPLAEQEWIPLPVIDHSSGKPLMVEPSGTEFTTLPDRGDGKLRITEVADPAIAIYPAAGVDGLAPAVLVIPGGGYQILAISHEGTELCQWLAEHGITAVLLRYRVPAQRAGAFADASQAMRLIRANAFDLGIDANRLGALGFSAGGHLLARLGATPPEGNFQTDPENHPQRHPHPDEERSFRPDFSVLVYPAYLAGPRENTIAPEVTPGRNTPPTLILQSLDDTAFVPGMRSYFKALIANGTASKKIEFADGGHGWGMRPPADSEPAQWTDLCLDWLRDQVEE